MVPIGTIKIIAMKATLLGKMAQEFRFHKTFKLFFHSTKRKEVLFNPVTTKFLPQQSSSNRLQQTIQGNAIIFPHNERFSE